MAEYKVISEFIDKKTNKRIKVGEVIELSDKVAKQALKAGVVEVFEIKVEEVVAEQTPEKETKKATAKEKSTKQKD